MHYQCVSRDSYAFRQVGMHTIIACWNCQDPDNQMSVSRLLEAQKTERLLIRPRQCGTQYLERRLTGEGVSLLAWLVIGEIQFPEYEKNGLGMP